MKIRSITFTKILLVLVCVALSSTAQAVLPAPDGGYPGGNTAEGQNALFSLTTGGFNTANGFLALRSNTIGQFNTAVGAGTLLANTADRNTATGAGALLSNTAGGGNTANGCLALFSNTTGGGNTANGNFALYNNTSGRRNTAIGGNALYSNIAGEANTAIGNNALQDNTGDFNIAIGQFAGSILTDGVNNIDIANFGVAGESNTIRIGDSVFQTRTFVAGISGVPVNGTGVVVASDGQLGVTPSSQRFKDQIEPMDTASESILALQPVTFRYKHEIDPKRIPQFGLVAEQVEKVNRDLVVCDGNGEIYTVRYDAINAMLLNEFLKEHRKVQQQEATIADVRSTIAQQRKDFETTTAQQHKQLQALTARLKEQTAQIQKVTTQIGLNRLQPHQVVLQNR